MTRDSARIWPFELPSLPLVKLRWTKRASSYLEIANSKHVMFVYMVLVKFLLPFCSTGLMYGWNWKPPFSCQLAKEMYCSCEGLPAVVIYFHLIILISRVLIHLPVHMWLRDFFIDAVEKRFFKLFLVCLPTIPASSLWFTWSGLFLGSPEFDYTSTNKPEFHSTGLLWMLSKTQN